MSHSLNNSNRLMFNKFVEIMRQEMTDVNFILESNGLINDDDVAGSPVKKIARIDESTGGDDDDDGGGNAIKIPAHKKVLAASSPVFKAMFTGPLTATGVVEIVNVSPDAFREFLQIFYEIDVKLTMENLGDVMKLIDKYDVKDGWPIVDAFLKKFTVDDILWGLHLAVKYQRDDLITIFTTVIEQNSAKVCDMIEIDDSGKPKLRSNPNQRPLTDTDLSSILSHIYAVMKKYISESVPAKAAGVVSLKLKFGESWPIDQLENISFSSNCTLLLTHIAYPRILTAVSSGFYDIKICIATMESVYKMPYTGGTIKFMTPVLIQANRIYTIQTEIITKFSPQPRFICYKSPGESVQVSPDIQITFDEEYNHSFVASVNFLRYDH